MDTSKLLFIDTETTGLVHQAEDYVLEVSYAEGTGDPKTFYPLYNVGWIKDYAVRRLNLKITEEGQRVGDLNHAFERWGEHLENYPHAEFDVHWERLYEMHESPDLSTIGQNVAFDLWMLTDANPFEYQFPTYKTIDLASYSMGFFGSVFDGKKPPSLSEIVRILNASQYPDKELITQAPDHTSANDVRSMQQVVRELVKMQNL